MKSSLNLSAVLLALSLAPATFANGTQEPSHPSLAAAISPTPSSTARAAEVAVEATSITRSVLARLDADLRTNLMNSLRASGLTVLQAVAPALVDTTSATGQFDRTSR